MHPARYESEERTDVVPQIVGQCTEPRSLGKRREGQVYEHIRTACLADLIPVVGGRSATDQRERARDAAEELSQLRCRREFAVHREASPLRDKRNERLDRFLVIDDKILALLDGWQPPLTSDPVHGERLFVCVVPEDVEDAGGCRDGAAAEYAFDPLAELFLGEELLEGALAGYDAVPLEIDGSVGCFPIESRRHDQQLPGEVPGSGEDDRTLGRILDDI